MAHLGGGNIFGGSGAPQSWKSQEYNHCKYCKCWVADNPVSKNFHEQGARHTKAFAESIVEGQRLATKKTKEENFRNDALRKMESAALEDYKEKDIGESRDFTAKLYNQEDVPQPQGVSYEAGPSKPGVIGPAKPRLVKEKKEHVDPMKAVTGDAPDKWDKDYLEKMEAAKLSEIKPVVAPRGGTKWHKPGVPLLWYEAKDDSDNSYFYHIKTGESRWDAPPHGYMSITDQQEVEDKQCRKEELKQRVVAEQQEVHGPSEAREERIHRALPDMSVKDPYGGGGWSSAGGKRESEEPPVDLGLPPKREKMERVIDVTEERLVIKEKTVTDLSSYGLVPLPDQVAKVDKLVVVTQPKISFRKRKPQNLRDRDSD